jgi:glycosyltransferase involved in cell wall biosynthesis
MCLMLTSLGHNVIHYGHGSPPCTTNVPILTDDEFKAAFGMQYYNNGFRIDSIPKDARKKINERTIAAINERKHASDFLLVSWGYFHKQIVAGVKLSKTVELGVGYHDDVQWPKYKIYESIAWYHRNLALQVEREGYAPPNNYHAYINGYFDPRDFEVSTAKEPYFLYIGRINTDKGIMICLDLSNKLGLKFKVAGRSKKFRKLLDESKYPNVEWVGPVGFKQRSDLMKHASATFAPSLYYEPFGSTIIESMMCGTPVITTDWGGATETVAHGITGFRARTFEDFVYATQNVHKLDSNAIRRYAVANFGIQVVRWKYHEYFLRLSDLHSTKGWYTPRPTRTQLDWLTKWLPGSNTPMPFAELNHLAPLYDDNAITSLLDSEDAQTHPTEVSGGAAAIEKAKADAEDAALSSSSSSHEEL